MTEKFINYTRNWKFDAREAREVVAWLNANRLPALEPGSNLPEEYFQHFMLKMRLPKYVECYECDKIVLLAFGGEHQTVDYDSGFDYDTRYQGEGSLCVDLSGGYGEFVDHMEPRNMLLCHDCCALFFRTFPNIAKTIGRGAHPSPTDRSCCEWAWRWNDETDAVEYGDGNGGWIAETPAG